MDISELALQAAAFETRISTLKEQIAPADFRWYPYGTLNNFIHFGQLLRDPYRDLISLSSGAPIVDIGAADGDSAFFLESVGVDAHIVDFAKTNYNGLRGAHLLRDSLDSRVSINDVDLDSAFELPEQRYSLALFLGILYHLKNPYSALEGLAKRASYALMSTRITRYNKAKDSAIDTDFNKYRVDLESVPAAYLVAPTETNNDPTNYWIFTEAGLRRILDRSGWDVLNFIRVGNTGDSDPASPDGDERAFTLVKSRFAA